MNKIPKIVIIGAGVAGLSAAVRLTNNRFTDFIILEAENRIGGRIQSVEFGDSLVDLGAQWCHGEENNVVYNAVGNLNLLKSSLNTYTQNIFCQAGDILNTEITNELFAGAFEIIDNEEAYCNNFERSFGDYFQESFIRRMKHHFSDRPEGLALIEDFLEWFHKFLLCYEAAPSWFSISSSNNEYEKCPGNQLLRWDGKGFQMFLDVLMRKYPNKNDDLRLEEKILLNKKVSYINWKAYNPDFEVDVHCTDGSLYNANHVIITIPLGALKHYNRTMFNPQLPFRKLNAIDNLGFGGVTKIFLKFPERWWDEDCKGFNFIWNDKLRADVRKNFSQYVKEDGQTWMENVFGFYIVDKNPTVLQGWLTGKRVADIETLPEEEVMEACYYIIKQFLSSLCNIPKPEKVLYSKWNTNNNFLGTWSYRSMDTQAKDTSAYLLSEPIRYNNKDVLLFAGEATHQYFYSTVHGAVESGFREADRIINCYKNPMFEKYKVVIVGGGVAALGAASTLVEHKISNFLILEASKRLGGRVKTVYLENKPLELGAQWIHGAGNAIHELARKNGLLSVDNSEEAQGTYVRDDGVVLNDGLIKKVDFKVGQILEECEQFIASADRPASVGHYLEQQFEETVKYLDPEEKEMYKELLDWHMRFQNIDNSCNDLKNLSVKEWGMYFCPGLNGQEHINLKFGFQSVVDILTRNLDASNVKVNAIVENIEWKRDDNLVKISCSNGTIYFCDHALVTCSLGVLKHCLQDMFTPPLPISFGAAINLMGFDAVGKVYLVFENKWWSVEGFQLIWRRDATLEEETKWTRHISGIDTVLGHPNVLVAWVAGKGVKMMEDLEEKVVGMHCVDLLRRFLKKEEIPYPSKVIRTSWLSNPFVRGGYAYSTPECENTGADRANLLELVSENGIPKIAFAGEAIHLTRFSTVHGAFESGKMQMEKLLDYVSATC